MWLGSAGKHDAIQVCVWHANKKKMLSWNHNSHLKGCYQAFERRLFSLPSSNIWAAGISEGCLSGHLEGEKMVPLLCGGRDGLVADQRWGVTKLGRNRRWVPIPHLPPSLYLHLKQLYARTKNGNLPFVLILWAFFAWQILWKLKTQTLRAWGGAVPPCPVVHILRDTGVSCPTAAAEMESHLEKIIIGRQGSWVLG